MIRFDFSDFERAARRMDALADQIPFALSKTLNDAAEVTRRQLIDETWAQHVTVRNPNFLKAALRVERSTKRNLTVTIFDRLGRGHLNTHAEGGTVTGKGKLAVPMTKNGRVRRGTHGVVPSQKPRSLPNSFVTDGRRANANLTQGAIYQRQGKYHKAGSKISRTGKTRAKGADGRTLKLMYVLKPSVSLKPTVPFEADFERTMRREVQARFPQNMRLAMATAFRKN